MLGEAQTRPSSNISYRSLSAISLALLRCLLHLSLLVGATQHQTSIAEMLHSQVTSHQTAQEENGLRLFFLQHLRVDIRALGDALQRNQDEIFIFLNLFLRKLLIPIGI